MLSAGLAFTGCDVNSDLQNENQSQSENQGTSQTYVLRFDDTLGGMNWRFADEDFVQPDDPEKTGYDFLGWFESGSDTAFSFENLNLNRNVFLTAKFAPTTYTVTYNLDGGTLADDAVKSYTVKDDDVDLTTTAIRAGYILDGWLLNDSKVTTISKDLLKNVSGKDIMLKANWLEAFTYSDEAKTIIKSLTSDAKNATEIVIPASVTSIGNSAFSGCSNLKNVYYDGTIVDWCNITFDDSYSNPMSVASHFYMKDENGEYQEVTEIVIPGAVTEIKDYAFYGFDNLTSVTIGKNVTSIGNDAFNGCSSLQYNTYDNAQYLGNSENPYMVLIKAESTDITSCEINENCKFIYSEAFQKCSSLTSINIPKSVTSIGSYAFYYCSSLTSITIPSGVTSIGSYAFRCCYHLVEVYNLSKLSITAGLYNNVGEYAKVIHTSLEEESNLVESNGIVYYVNGDEKIAVKPVDMNATSVTLDSDCTSINQYAFLGCSSLTLINIPANVTSIGEWAFYYCSSLTSINIPANVTSIGSYAFEYCYHLVEVYNLSKLSITAGSIDYGYVGCYAKVIHTSLEEKSNLVESNGVVYYNYNGKKIAVRPVDMDATSVTLDSDCTSINQYAFRECLSLTTITIPANVTSIGGFAFYCCENLTSINIPANVTSIGYYAFYKCSSLTSINIPKSVTSIGSYAFSDCSKLTTVTFEEGSQLTRIGNYAFYKCSSLTSITIPANVTSIGRWAFSGCPKLTTVTFEDTRGWYVSTSSTATSGTTLTLGDTSTNAEYLKSTYYDYDWKKSTT